MAEELLGDVNCDGAVNLVDVAPFVEAILIGEFSTKADINLDGIVNLLDVGPFVGKRPKSRRSHIHVLFRELVTRQEQSLLTSRAKHSTCPFQQKSWKDAATMPSNE